MTYLSRTDWGARDPRKRTPVAKNKRTGVAFHHTTGSNLGRDDCAAWVRAIQDYHMNTRGWDDIGYQRLVCRHGDVFEGRAFGNQGAHAVGHNITHIGICAMGDLRDQDQITDDLIRGLIAEYEAACEWAGRALDQIGHGQLPGAATACPGLLAGMLPLTTPEGDTPDLSGKLVIDAKPIITQRAQRPSAGSRIERETRRVQAELKRVHGINPGAIDGWPGPRTAEAVKKLQRRHGARLVDGIPGPETWPMILS